MEKDTDFLFGISGDGDVIVLLDASGAEVDRVSVPTLEDGQTYARDTDGGETWEVKENGTKGVSNSADPMVPEESDLNLKDRTQRHRDFYLRFFNLRSTV